MNLVKDATKEIMFIFPTINAFVRQQKLGIIQLLKKAAKQYNVKIRILMPINKLIEKDLYDLKQQDNITVRLIGQISDTQATFLIVSNTLSRDEKNDEPRSAMTRTQASDHGDQHRRRPPTGRQSGGSGAPAHRLRAASDGRRGQRTMRRLLDAGSPSSPARGYHSARVDDIVKAAKTSHGTFYILRQTKRTSSRHS